MDKEKTEDKLTDKEAYEKTDKKKKVYRKGRDKRRYSPAFISSGT